MTTITIHETTSISNGFAAVVAFNHGRKEYPITITDPFTPRQEDELAWYFEEHLRYPYMDTVRAEQAAASIIEYGHRLFEQVFMGDTKQSYKNALNGGVATIQLEIAGSTAFQALHWEALKDPNLPRPFALEVPIVRKNITPQYIKASPQESPTLNVLVVTARAANQRDIAYRTISRPLVEGIQQAKIPVHIDILRPGTYRALSAHLEQVRTQHKTGFYHLIHFDLHGAVLTHDQLKRGMSAHRYLYQARFGRDDLEHFEDPRAFLFLEGENDTPYDPTVADEIAQLLMTHNIPIVVLNACQSGQEVGDSETSLARHLMVAGVQIAVGMCYSVSVTGAQRFITHLYQSLFDGQDFGAALRLARLALAQDRGRRGHFDRIVDLEDWLLPVAYQNHPVQLPLRDFTTAEATTFYTQTTQQYAYPQPTYGFVGRDLDILNIERKLLRPRADGTRNLLLVRGMGGAGKTTLLRHLAAWWQTTHFVDQVFYFGYDERAWTREQITHAIAKDLLGEAVYYSQYLPLPDAARVPFLTQRLRGTRHLLILDNLESITGTNLAIQNTLPPTERAQMRNFLAQLRGGRTLVLLGTRGGEDWLITNDGTPAPLRNDDIYNLPGLDPEAATILADRLLERYGVTQYRTNEDFHHLLSLLDGYPLAIEVVLPNLKTQTLTEILTALSGGEEGIDLKSNSKTESILRCIDYSHSNLSPEAQDLLACLAPFTGVFSLIFLENYTTQLQAQSALAHLPFERWDEVLQEAINWGLLSPHPQMQGYLQIQPVFPYFVRNRLSSPQFSKQDTAIQIAFRQHYDWIGDTLHKLMVSKDSQERQLGQALTHLEYENLHTALDYALAAQVSILNPYLTISIYLDTTQDHHRGLALGQSVLARLETYPPATLAGQLGAEFPGVLDNIAKLQLLSQDYAGAQASYQKVLDILLANTYYEQEQLKKLSANVYHQLGRVTQKQRDFIQAHYYYQQALDIFIAFNDRHPQATVYHQLGMVAEEQRDFPQAHHYYQQALAIDSEFNDRYAQASTYHQLGMVAQEQRDFVQAYHHYQQALDIYVEFNNRYEQADTYHQLGRVAEEQRDFPQAHHYYQQALDIFIAFNDRYAQAGTYHQLGRVAEEQRDFPQAHHYYQQALEIFIAFNDRHNQAKTYNQLGIVALVQRDFEQAKDYNQQALAIKTEFNNRRGQAHTYHQLGRVAQEQRNFAQAHHYFQQALDIYIEFNDHYEQAGTYHQLGMVAEEQRNFAHAHHYFQQALDIKIEFNDRYSQATTLHALGGVVQEQRKFDEALNYYQQALQLSIEFNDRHLQAMVYHQLGTLTQEQHNFAQAHHYYQQALDIFIEFNDYYEQAGTYGQLGLLAETQKNWKQAQEYLLQALEIFAQFQDNHNAGQVLQILTRFWKASNDPTLLGAVAGVLGVAEAEVLAMFREAIEG